jgi:hypothetical protein
MKQYVLALLFLALHACGKADETRATGGNPGSETHWLMLCDSTDECGDGVCACGVCTLLCESSADCAPIDTAEVSCVAPESVGCSERASGACLPREAAPSASNSPEAGPGTIRPVASDDSGAPVAPGSATGTSTTPDGGEPDGSVPDSGNAPIAGSGGSDGRPTDAGGDAGEGNDAGDPAHPYCGRDDPSTTDCTELASVCSANSTCCVCTENPSEPGCGYFWACVNPDNLSANCPAQPPLEGDPCVATIGALPVCGYCVAEGPVTLLCGRLETGSEEGVWMRDDYSDNCLQ